MVLPHNLRAPVSITKPRPVGICDRCSFLRYLDDLTYQMIWTGPALTKLNIRVCPKCLDVPNEQLRTIIIGPDPAPLKDPRPPYWAEQEEGGVPAPDSVQEILGD